MIYFTLLSSIYAARYEKAIIILDVDKDSYISLIQEAAVYLELILDTTFNTNDGSYTLVDSQTTYDTQTLQQWIDEFKTRGFIAETSSVKRKGLAQQPKTTGGLREYKWDTKTDWKPFSKASWLAVIPAYLQLTRIHRLIKNKNLKGLFGLLKKYKTKVTRVPQPADLEQLGAAVDAASILYPKKTYCLASATTFVLEARRRGWQCDLVIGVQSNPFYAHAWAELGGIVLNDDPHIAQVLSIMCREPGI